MSDYFRKDKTSVASVHTYEKRKKNWPLTFKTTQTDNKPNFGAGGNRKVKVSLAKVNLPEDREGK